MADTPKLILLDAERDKRTRKRQRDIRKALKLFRKHNKKGLLKAVGFVLVYEGREVVVGTTGDDERTWAELTAGAHTLAAGLSERGS